MGLEGAAHPRALRRVAEGGSIVPASVRCQLEVWETGRSRTASWNAVFFEWEPGEIDAATFAAVRKHAEEDGSFLWSRGDEIPADGARALHSSFGLVVKAESAARMRAFLARSTSRK